MTREQGMLGIRIRGEWFLARGKIFGHASTDDKPAKYHKFIKIHNGKAYFSTKYKKKWYDWEIKEIDGYTEKDFEVATALARATSCKR